MRIAGGGGLGLSVLPTFSPAWPSMRIRSAIDPMGRASGSEEEGNAVVAEVGGDCGGWMREAASISRSCSSIFLARGSIWRVMYCHGRAIEVGNERTRQATDLAEFGSLVVECSALTLWHLALVLGTAEDILEKTGRP